MWSMLNNMDYARFMEHLVMIPANQKLSFSYSSAASYTSSTLMPTNDSDKILVLDDDEIIKMAETNMGSKLLQQNIEEHGELCGRFITILSCQSKNGKEFLNQLASDSNGNFIIQKLIEVGADAASPLIESIKKATLDLALNRYGCRVIQKLVIFLSPNEVRNLLCSAFGGQEFLVITDQNGNHVIQSIINKFHPEVYADFMKSLVASVGLKQVVENKYGCRVVQCALEQVIQRCEDDQQQQNLESASHDTAYKLLRLLLTPILNEAKTFANNEFANYIVQVVLKSDFLAEQRRYIIKEHFMHGILVLSQGKFSSHVVEVALCHADDNCLAAMFLEILEGYEPDKDGRNALHFMLFNQFGNYVVQRMLEIANEIRKGRRKGDFSWFDTIVSYALSVRGHLFRYSSGKKILDMIHQALPSKHLYPNHLKRDSMRFINPPYNYTGLFTGSNQSSMTQPYFANYGCQPSIF